MTLWSLGLASVAIIALLLIPAWGYWKFNPKRARSVKLAERDDVEVVQRRVVELAVHHPEIVKHPRLDRHLFYIGPHVGVLSYALCIFSGATPTSNVVALGSGARLTMAWCFVVGVTLILCGSSLGFWKVGRRVRVHPTSPLLGDDIVVPYRVGIAGLSCVMVSMTIYARTSFGSTTGSLGGWLTASLAVVSFLMIVQMYRATRRFERDEQTLITEVHRRLGDELD